MADIIDRMIPNADKRTKGIVKVAMLGAVGYIAYKAIAKGEPVDKAVKSSVNKVVKAAEKTAEKASETAAKAAKEVKATVAPAKKKKRGRPRKTAKKATKKATKKRSKKSWKLDQAKDSQEPHEVAYRKRKEKIPITGNKKIPIQEGA